MNAMANRRTHRQILPPFGLIGWLLCLLASQAHAAITATILAGGETDLPADTPSGRSDT